MFNSTNGTQLTMPVVPAGASGGFGGSWGDNGFFWIIILIVLFGGWGYGNGGWGGYGNGGAARETTSVYEGYVLNNDMSMLNKAVTDSYSMTERKLDGIANGLCDGFYTQSQLINGIDKSIANSNYAIQNAIQQDTIAGMQNTNAIQTQLAQCCCDNKSAISDVKYTIGSTGADISRGIERGFSDTNYNMATQANGITNAMQSAFCQTNFNAQTNTRDIVDSQNAGTQAILARLDAMETNRLREQLESERDARYALQGQLDRAQLRTDIVNEIHPCPKPMYQSCNPWGCNCNQGCGC
ncbi:MAG: hypothetical protein Q4D29_10165 [Lachnospiraceae bacterium]|nr:hypothetical protein [Lachnospiraceae bacterium]